MKNALTVVCSLLLVAAGVVAATALGGNDKVTICHAAGQDGTLKYVTLTISEDAVYGRNGNAGHFDENGTPKAGHEQDYFGACEVDTTTDTTPTDTTPTDTTPTTPTETTPSHDCTYTGAGKDGQPGNDDCAPLPTPPPAVTPPATVPPAAAVPPAVTVQSVTTTVAPKPSVKSAVKPNPKAKPKSKPKSKSKAKVPANSGPHVCKTLVDGTKRAWFKGGNGLPAGCYAVIQGSG